MAYKIRYSSSIFFLSVFFANISVAQECPIQQEAFKTFYFKPGTLTNKNYEQLKHNDKSAYQIMLINSSSLSNSTLSYYVSIDSNLNLKIVHIKNDSIIYSGCLNANTQKYKLERMLRKKKLNGFYVSDCEKYISSHNKQLLVICKNESQLYVEYLQMNGHVKETLENQLNYLYLKDAYQILEDVFRDLQFNIN